MLSLPSSPLRNLDTFLTMKLVLSVFILSVAGCGGSLSGGEGSQCGTIAQKTVPCQKNLLCVSMSANEGKCSPAPDDGNVYCTATNTAHGSCPAGLTCFTDSSIQLASPYYAGICKTSSGQICGGNSSPQPTCTVGSSCELLAGQSADASGQCIVND